MPSSSQLLDFHYLDGPLQSASLQELEAGASGFVVSAPNRQAPGVAPSCIGIPQSPYPDGNTEEDKDRASHQRSE